MKKIKVSTGDWTHEFSEEDIMGLVAVEPLQQRKSKLVAGPLTTVSIGK